MGRNRSWLNMGQAGSPMQDTGSSEHFSVGNEVIMSMSAELCCIHVCWPDEKSLKPCCHWVCMVTHTVSFSELTHFQEIRHKKQQVGDIVAIKKKQCLPILQLGGSQEPFFSQLLTCNYSLKQFCRAYCCVNKTTIVVL